MTGNGKQWLAAIGSAAICLAIGGCAGDVRETQAAPVRYQTTFVGAMDTVVGLTAYCRTSAQFDAAADAVRQELDRLDAVFSRYRTDSALARVNAGAGGPGVAAPSELTALIERCRAWQTATPGVNIAMGGVLQLWHTARETGVPPSPEALRAAIAQAILQKPQQHTMDAHHASRSCRNMHEIGG